ncbi:MAG: phosphatase PAP2 family protein, partial [Blastocatellia bacterium]
GHTELTLLVLYCAWRFHRPTFWTILIPAMMLIFSTVYLRYHYAIDVISGTGLALMVALVADRLFISLGGRFPSPEECSP